MASCYHCGAYGADYRRTVNTGNSVGAVYGKRTSMYTSSHYSKRSLCMKCAFESDRSSLVTSITILWVIAIGLLFAIFYFVF